jgi:hypothetical protein
MSLSQEFVRDTAFHAEILGKLAVLREIALELGLYETEFAASWSYYGQPSITLYFGENQGEAVKKLISEMQEKTGEKFSREFDEGVWVHAAELRGVLVVVRESAPPCAFTTEEEEVEVPARIEKRTKFVLVDPNCGAAEAAAAAAAASAEAGILDPKEIPF